MEAPATTPYPLDPRYGVTRDGRVFRIVRSHSHGRRVPFEITPRADKDGYLLMGGGKATYKVHRMVAQTFIENPCGYQWVAHNNGVRGDNRVENLRWDSISANLLDKRKHGTNMCGEVHYVAKLTENMVREARARAATGESHASIAKDMPVERSVLSRAICGVTWSHV